MLAPQLLIDRSALVANWSRLNALCDGKAAAVIKANGYGLGANEVAQSLWQAGAKVFFVATYCEAMSIAEILPEAEIYELSGLSVYAPKHPKIIPVLNSMPMVQALDDRPFALQFDTGMTRLGLDLNCLSELQDLAPKLVMSHLACADDPQSEMNRIQLSNFNQIALTYSNSIKSFSNTGGILLGKDYHFDLARPGIGIYGGAPFNDAQSVVQMRLPVLQFREIDTGTKVGYGGSFTAARPMRVATLLGGYADGLHRVLSGNFSLYSQGIPCPCLGRISMDSITVDISALDDSPEYLELFSPEQNLDELADRAGTIGYEILTSFGARLERIWQ